MQYQLTEEQENLRKTVYKLAEEKVAPRAAAIDETGEFPWDIYELFKANDLVGLRIPKEYGGSGASFVTCYLVVEEIARFCATSSNILAVGWLGCEPILVAGNEEQKRKYLTPFAKGEGLAAFALTERQAGSDASYLMTKATLQGDHYVLNGSKCFINHGSIAKTYCVFALTDPEKKTRGISGFIVERDFPGFSIGKIENKMGIRGAQVAELIFENCRVPKENLLGQEGQGFRYAMITLDHTRPGIGAQAVGIAQGALDYAIKWAKERVQFGGPIANLQAIQFMLADLAIQTEAARQLVYVAASALDQNKPNISYLSAVAKAFAGDTAMKVTTDAVQICGGYGYMKDLPVERMMRDAKITQIYEGTNQIMRVVISRALLA